MSRVLVLVVVVAGCRAENIRMMLSHLRAHGLTDSLEPKGAACCRLKRVYPTAARSMGTPHTLSYSGPCGHESDTVQSIRARTQYLLVGQGKLPWRASQVSVRADVNSGRAGSFERRTPPNAPR
jgi:lysyl-tRNA synthetase class I